MGSTTPAGGPSHGALSELVRWVSAKDSIRVRVPGVPLMEWHYDYQDRGNIGYYVFSFEHGSDDEDGWHLESHPESGDSSLPSTWIEEHRYCLFVQGGDDDDIYEAFCPKWWQVVF